MKVKSEIPYKILMPLVRFWFKIYYNPTIINKEAIPKKGPIIIAGNHLHAFDQFPTMCATKRVIHYMAKKEYFDSKISFIFKLAGCIPVNRQIKDTSAKEAALEVLNNDGAIGIFPEGTRNKTEEFLLPFKFGAVSMASKTNATIVPFGLAGDYKFRSKNLIVIYGTPFKVEDMSLEEANEKLRKEVEKLKRQCLEKQD